MAESISWRHLTSSQLERAPVAILSAAYAELLEITEARWVAPPPNKAGLVARVRQMLDIERELRFQGKLSPSTGRSHPAKISADECNAFLRSLPPPQLAGDA